MFDSSVHRSTASESLSFDTLRQLVPSAFATEKHAERSERYTHIPTSAVLEGLQREGYVPTFAQQSKCRDEARKNHTKHLIRFRPEGVVPTVGGLCPELVLLNSHDGTSAYQLFAGVFRFVCANGLMVGNSFEAVKVRHQGDVVRDVIDASFTVIQESRRAVEDGERMLRLPLNHDERQAFARAAHGLRFEASSLAASIHPEQLLHPRRAADRGADLFTTLNVVQENLMRGGLRGWQRNEQGQHRRVTTRAVNGIDQNSSLNRALWTLAAEMEKLKTE